MNMLKKRLIYTLLVQDNIIQLSRNFSLQAVGDLEWLYSYYDFDSIANSVDELVLLNVGRGEKNITAFADFIIALSRKCFMPIAAGGGISSVEDAYRILDAGADKLIINSALFKNPDLVKDLVKIFGSQCIIASIDYKVSNSVNEVFTFNGTMSTGLTVEGTIKNVVKLGVGEIYLTSMDRDGTGQGYDLPLLANVVKLCQVPIIASGGVGDYDHFVSGMQIEGVTGTSTANIFNFIGEGLTEARNYILNKSMPLAQWDFNPSHN
jgi:imidazole glycerol-phosphate synthase subunit HisF